ncbi:(myosin heavy-chain) kinase : Uncultured bacterium genome assembly Metasoil_fosmids_resub OS=uncultured bacterium PE=4 SV=1: Sigma70_r2: Sigma70_r4_2: WD40 [Gemmata massiliana]|uniref:RNA polymerase sigma-70 region 2 domain-containing protein n=1 Tax=Gemmata massiliana TaxID=1210884 RepID=A0A6P2CUZ2_9BACT|nr:sigma-70 family RNA polymerase sigma factor [Gemmata massiliana]VTR91965.1 (myosin heavy-chain) kinase : Uncultured bacterium genome assembly Metasoil_fosmids_resub OS=uncultured bacterium PE=4 SV=1: Sigma70_r2: Sigma70_r4_2: WD40 [Gemmata massiliana]
MRLTAALQLVRTVERAPVCDTSDAELLRRFCRDRDEGAFREILRRYEALVRDASRRLTRDRHAVDDAAQATFLTLARKAHTIRHAEALPSWLYRVARSVTARPVAVVPTVTEPVDPTSSPLDQLSAREVLAIFDEELARLPAAHRSAVLLCTIEGNTVEDTARRLGTTPGAVRGWLQRGRETLRHRLGRRGVELSVAVSLLLIDSTTGTAGATLDAIVRGAMATHSPVNVVTRFLTGSSVTSAVVSVLVAGAVASVVLLSSGASAPPPVPEPKAEAKVDTQADALVTRDGLPEGAVARIGSPRLRHAGEVAAMAFSRDGRRLATASPANRDKSVRVWDLTNGKEMYRVPVAVNSHENTERHRTVAVAFTADDKRLLVLDAAEFRTFDATTGRQELVTVLFKETNPNQFFPPDRIIGAGFSPDANVFVVVRQNGEMVLGDTTAGTVKRIFTKAMTVPENTHYAHVDVLFTPDGTEVCVPIPGEPVPLFDVATGKSKRALAKELVSQHQMLHNAAFADGGRKFVTITSTAQEGKPSTHAITIGDIATGKVLRTIPLTALPRVLSASPNGKLLAVSTDSVSSSEIRVLDLESGKELQSMPLELTPALVTFSPDSRLLAGTCHYEGRVTVWNLEKNARHPQSADEHARAAHFDARGNVVLRQSSRTITVNWQNGKVLGDKKELKPESTFSHLGTESGDGKVRATLDVPEGKSGRPLAILVKETDTGKTVARLEGLSDFPWRMVFADRNRLVVTVTQDNVLTVWDVVAGKVLWSEAYPARSLGYSGMGAPHFDAANSRMAIGSLTQKGTVIDVWELRRHNRVSRVEAPGPVLTGGIAFSPDGAFIAGGSETVTCWRVSDGRVMHTLKGHATKESPNDRPAISCEFSADGRKLLTVDGTGTIRVWEFATGQVIRTFSGHKGPTTAHFAPDARAIVGASYEAPVFVWDVYGLGAPTSFNADRVWTDLADASSTTAFRAVRELCASPKEAIALLKQKLEPESIDPKAIAGWVKDLSSEQFADRERATAELEKRGETIASLLREALGAATDAETRQRLTAILGRIDRPSPTALRLHRAMDALEHLGTPEAKSHLETLSRGALKGSRTIQAKEALSRISER